MRCRHYVGFIEQFLFHLMTVLSADGELIYGAMETGGGTARADEYEKALQIRGKSLWFSMFSFQHYIHATRGSHTTVLLYSFCFD